MILLCYDSQVVVKRLMSIVDAQKTITLKGSWFRVCILVNQLEYGLANQHPLRRK